MTGGNKKTRQEGRCNQGRHLDVSGQNESTFGSNLCQLDDDDDDDGYSNGNKYIISANPRLISFAQALNSMYE
jgi:hypothetical protein